MENGWLFLCLCLVKGLILPDGYQQVFIVSTEGGTPRQITTGDYNYNGISWRPDSKAIVVSTNQKDNWQAAPNDTEVYEINLADNQLKSLTDRRGPDNVVGYSPDGKWIANIPIKGILKSLMQI